MDLNVAEEHMLTNENNVAIAYTVTGTHQGDFMGGRRPANASACGVQIARFENGRIVARWGSWDELGKGNSA